MVCITCLALEFAFICIRKQEYAKPDSGPKQNYMNRCVLHLAKNGNCCEKKKPVSTKRLRIFSRFRQVRHPGVLDNPNKCALINYKFVFSRLETVSFQVQGTNYTCVSVASILIRSRTPCTHSFFLIRI